MVFSICDQMKHFIFSAIHKKGLMPPRKESLPQKFYMGLRSTAQWKIESLSHQKAIPRVRKINQFIGHQ